jgi:hypothetical protein
MGILMMIEQGKVLWQCNECDTTFADSNEFAYGHDCEV